MKASIYIRHRDIQRFLAVAAVSGLATVIVWGVGAFRFAASIPTTVADTTTRTDAIVVLTGGSGRLDAGLDLLAGKFARKLFVSGVYQGVDVAKLLELSRRTPEELQCCVEIGHSADNTRGNAAETAQWMNKQGFHSLRIVTSGYHVPRAALEFRYVLPGVNIIIHPVFPKHVKRKQWYIWPGTASLIIREYNKFLLAWTRMALARLFTGVGAGADAE